MSARVEPMSQRREAYSPWAPVVWTILSLLLFVASSMGIFVLNTLPGLAGLPDLVVGAEWSVVWGALALVGVLLAGRVAFGRWLRVTAAAVVVAGLGISLSAVFNVVLHQWAIDRFGYFDSDFIWWTASLFAVLVALAITAFGVFVAPPGSAAWPLSFVLVAAGATLFIVLGNMPGLNDGIEAESWPLAIWIGLSGLYAAAVTIACVIRARHLAATPER